MRWRGIVSRRMRYAILGDIHGNLAAFKAVFRDMELKGGWDKVWCLGDIVGYGPEPRECIELLRQYDHLCVAGNHDWGAIGKIDTSDFNPVAARACLWTAQQLTEHDIKYLESLPVSLGQDDFTLVHGSPRHPIWEYLLSTSAARESFSYFKTSYCLIGHSHVPLIFEFQDKAGTCKVKKFPDGARLELSKQRLIINPGGVGQPRDGDPRASYGIYDSEARVIYHYRVEYDVTVTQRKMTAVGLPLPLISRLSYGM